MPVWNRRGVSYHDDRGIWGVVLLLAAIALAAVLCLWFPLSVFAVVLALFGLCFRKRKHQIAHWAVILVVMGSVAWHWSEFREHEHNYSEWSLLYIRSHVLDFVLPSILTPETLDWKQYDGVTKEAYLQKVLGHPEAKSAVEKYLSTLVEGFARGIAFLSALTLLAYATIRGVQRWLPPRWGGGSPDLSMSHRDWRIPSLLFRTTVNLCLIVLVMLVGLAIWVLPQGVHIDLWTLETAWKYWLAWLLAAFVPDTATLAMPGTRDGEIVKATLDAIRDWEPYGGVSARAFAAIWDWLMIVVPPLALLVTVLFGYPVWRRERRLAWGASFAGLRVANPWELKAVTGRLPWDQSPYSIAGTRWPRGGELRHTLVTGGALKDEAIGDVLAQIRKRGDKAVVLDGTGEFANRFFAKGQDTILDPADNRSTGLDIFGESTTQQEFGELAKTLIPELEKAKDPEWTAKARELFTAVAVAMANRGERDPATLVRYLTESDAGKLTALMEGAGVPPPSSLADYASISTAKALLRPHLQRIPLASGTPGEESGDHKPPFSFRRWLDEPGRSGGFVFVSGGAENSGEGGAASKVNAEMLQMAMETLCSMDKDASRMVWLVAPHGARHLSEWIVMNRDEIGRSGGCILEGRETVKRSDEEGIRMFATRLHLPPGNGGWESWKYAQLLNWSDRDDFQMAEYERLPPFDGFLFMPEFTMHVPVRISASRGQRGGFST